MDYYKKIQNKYGLPLDNRKDLHQARLDHLDRHAHAEPRGLRGADRSGLPLPERDARPLAADRLVSDQDRAQGRLHRAAR